MSHSSADHHADNNPVFNPNRKLTRYEQVIYFEELTQEEKFQFFMDAGLTPKDLLMIKDLTPRSRKAFETDGPLPDDHYMLNNMAAATRLMKYKQAIIDEYEVIHGVASDDEEKQ